LNGDIALHGKNFGTRHLQLFGRLLKFFEVSACNHHIDPVLGKYPGYPLADTSSATRDNSNLVGFGHQPL
jgi:hypothetical protein